MGRSTRLLVTHQRQFLPACDRILVLRGGRPVALGTWDQVSQLQLSELTAGHTGAVTLGEGGEGGGVEDVKAALAAAGDVSVDELLDQQEAAAAGNRGQQQGGGSGDAGEQSDQSAGPSPLRARTQPQLVLPATQEEEEGEEIEELQNTAARPVGVLVEAEGPVVPGHPPSVTVTLDGVEGAAGAPETPQSSAQVPTPREASLTSPRRGGGPQPRLTRIVSGAWLGQLSSRRWLPAALNLASGPSMSSKSRGQVTGLEGAWREDSNAAALGSPAGGGGGKARLTWALSGSRSFLARTLTFRQPGQPRVQGDQVTKDAGKAAPSAAQVVQLRTPAVTCVTQGGPGTQPMLSAVLSCCCLSDLQRRVSLSKRRTVLWGMWHGACTASEYGEALSRAC
jgi:hypothetical protein